MTVKNIFEKITLRISVKMSSDLTVYHRHCTLLSLTSGRKGKESKKERKTALLLSEANEGRHSEDFSSQLLVCYRLYDLTKYKNAFRLRIRMNTDPTRIRHQSGDRRSKCAERRKQNKITSAALLRACWGVAACLPKGRSLVRILSERLFAKKHRRGKTERSFVLL
jgi:hypothetical protein